VVIDCTYDDLYRLTSAVYSTGESYTYSYDPVGNRESLVTDSGSTSYEYDAADRLTSVNGTTYTWDDNGNLTSDGTRTFTYDAADRLLTVTGGGTNASYTYNGDGLRVGETVNSVSTSYAWDVAAPLPQVLANSGGATYVYGLGLLAQQQSGAWQYPLADGLGSVRHQVDPLGQVVASYRFSPFGVPLAASGGQPYGYAGEHWDAYTSLIYLRARWYDPATGRFLTRDPFPGLATLPATQHPYVYAGNNPVNLVDPSGEIAPILVAAGVGGVIGGVAGGARYVLAHPGGRPEDYLRSGDFWKATGVGFASGAVAGATGFWIGGVAAGTGLGGAIAGGIWSGAATGAAGQVTANLLTPCVDWHDNLAEAAVFGGLTGGIAGGAGYGARQWMANRIGPITPPTNRAGLRKSMGQPPPGIRNAQAHHDLPWEFKDWFAGPRRGLNVNDPHFGRWVEGTPPGQHQNWWRFYNDAWRVFKESNPTADKWQVLDHLRQLISSGRYP
jgi:RHS repeat-associated protein